MVIRVVIPVTYLIIGGSRGLSVLSLFFVGSAPPTFVFCTIISNFLLFYYGQLIRTLI